MLLCVDAISSAAELAGGRLACPSCPAGQLARWGHGRERVIRLPGGARVRLRPDRARCRACKRTYILLPAWCVPRRADGVQVIAAALAESLRGAGYARIGQRLGVPASTVRGWLRRLRGRAEEMRCYAMAELGALCQRHVNTDPGLPDPAATPLGEALNAVAAAACAAITRFRLPPQRLWPLLGRLGLAAHLAPPARRLIISRRARSRHARSPASPAVSLADSVSVPATT